jgi:hypothetical protein
LRVKKFPDRPVLPAWMVHRACRACPVPRESAEPAAKWAREASLACPARRGRLDYKGRRADRETWDRQGRMARRENRV